jgi:toxin secretion/phage lysis holin
MHPLEVFIEPVSDPKAQVAVVALCLLAALDVLFGVLNAWFVQHDFSTHEFREGLIRKLSNFGLVVAADIVDAMLLGGLNLGIQPVLMTITVSLAVMEIMSLLEIFAEMHPEISDAPWYKMLRDSKEGLQQ